MDHDLKSLPSDTVRLIGSSQVITSVYSVVKELVENSLDSDATAVEVKLENYGLDKVEVRDNGHGIKESNMPCVAKRYHTSKISSFSDLETLSSYGFRGEALGSLCTVSSLSITSKTMQESVSYTYQFDQHGNITAKQPSHVGQGTTISASHLFKNLPVRRQFYSTIKKKKEELKRIEDLMMAYGCIKPGVRFLLKHGKETVWQKNGLADTRTALLGILGRNVVMQMEHKIVTCDSPEMVLECYIPGPKSDVNLTSRSTNDRGFIAVNSRPVQVKEIEKSVRQFYCSCMGIEGKYPIYYLALKMSTNTIDVNVDPNKTRVMLLEKKSILSKINDVLEEVYGPLINKQANDISQDNSHQNSPSDASSSSLNDSDINFDKRDQAADIKRVEIGQFVSNSKVKSTENDHENGNIPTDGPSVKISFYEQTVVKDDRITTKTIETDNNDLADKTMESKRNNLSDGTCADKQLSDKLTLRLLDDSSEDRGKDLGISAQLKDKSEMNSCTQRDQASFDFFDKEFEDLLKSQRDDCSTEIVDVDAALDILGDVPKQTVNNTDVNDVNHKNDKATLDKGQTPMKEDTKDTNKAKNWSVGKSEIGSDGNVLQPVMLLAPNSSVNTNKRTHSQTDSDLALTPPLKRKSLDVQANQPRLYDIVGKSPKEKFSMGFIAFSKEDRPKVIEDNPDMSYDEITKLVCDRWDKMSDTDRKQYENTGNIQVEELKKKVAEKQRLADKQRLAARTSRKLDQCSTIKDKLLAESSSSPNITPIQTVKVKFSLQILRDRYQTGVRQSQNLNHSEMSLIGPLKFYNGWICCHGNKVKVINPHRVEETILFRELLENHVISTTKLDQPIRLDESVLGQSLLQVLVRMIPTNSCQTYIYIEDKRITSNGFQIRCHLDENNCPVLELDAISKCMPTYSVQDLKEVVGLINDTAATSLQHCRPVKVIYYLQGEAVRMVRQRPLVKTREDMQDLLEQMNEVLTQDCVKCLHDKPFLHTVYDLIDIPATQLTQE